MKTAFYYQHQACEDDLKSEPFSQIILQKWLAPLPRTQKILDFGTGIGANLKTLKTLGFKNIHAADISPLAVKIIHKKFPDIKIKLLKEIKLPYSNNCFDLILATEVLEHIFAFTKTLKELDRILKKGGLLVISTPNYLNLTGLIKLFKDWRNKKRSWNPWGTHVDGYENFITSFSLIKHLKNYKILNSLGLDFYLAWFYWLPKYFWRFHRYLIFYPSTLPFFKYFAMHYYLLLQKK